MADEVSIGIQDFGELRKRSLFYVDKSLFIKEWWDSGDDVTFITRPRRFGKTKVLNKRAGEKSLEDTAAGALKQIEEKKYDTDLLARGIPADNILKYGFAFEGEKCLIVKG